MSLQYAALDGESLEKPYLRIISFEVSGDVS